MLRILGCIRAMLSAFGEGLWPWADGGTTCSANLMPLCSRHHYLKHDGNWNLEKVDDGTVRWTTPAGRTYDKPPPDPLPRDSFADPPPF